MHPSREKCQSLLQLSCFLVFVFFPMMMMIITMLKIMMITLMIGDKTDWG